MGKGWNWNAEGKDVGNRLLAIHLHYIYIKEIVLQLQILT